MNYPHYYIKRTLDVVNGISTRSKFSSWKWKGNISSLSLYINQVDFPKEILECQDLKLFKL